MPWVNKNIHISFSQNLFHKTESQRNIIQKGFAFKDDKYYIVCFPSNK